MHPPPLKRRRISAPDSTRRMKLKKTPSKAGTPSGVSAAVASAEADIERRRLLHERAASEYRLKAAWEAIFAKYDRDTSDIADEIDLETGKIVVDRGHLRSLEASENTDGTVDDLWRDWESHRDSLGKREGKGKKSKAAKILKVGGTVFGITECEMCAEKDELDLTPCTHGEGKENKEQNTTSILPPRTPALKRKGLLIRTPSQSQFHISHTSDLEDELSTPVLSKFPVPSRTKMNETSGLTPAISSIQLTTPASAPTRSQLGKVAKRLHVSPTLNHTHKNQTSSVPSSPPIQLSSRSSPPPTSSPPIRSSPLQRQANSSRSIWAPLDDDPLADKTWHSHHPDGSPPRPKYDRFGLLAIASSPPPLFEYSASEEAEEVCVEDKEEEHSTHSDNTPPHPPRHHPPQSSGPPKSTSRAIVKTPVKRTIKTPTKTPSKETQRTPVSATQKDENVPFPKQAFTISITTKVPLKNLPEATPKRIYTAPSSTTREPKSKTTNPSQRASPQPFQSKRNQMKPSSLTAITDAKQIKFESPSSSFTAQTSKSPRPKNIVTDVGFTLTPSKSSATKKPSQGVKRKRVDDDIVLELELLSYVKIVSLNGKGKGKRRNGLIKNKKHDDDGEDEKEEEEEHKDIDGSEDTNPKAPHGKGSRTIGRKLSEVKSRISSTNITKTVTPIKSGSLGGKYSTNLERKNGSDNSTSSNTASLSGAKSRDTFPAWLGNPTPEKSATAMKAQSPYLSRRRLENSRSPGANVSQHSNGAIETAISICGELGFACGKAFCMKCLEAEESD